MVRQRQNGSSQPVCACSAPGSIRDTVAVLAGNFLPRQLFLGGGLGVGQQCVDQEQRSICVLTLVKFEVPNPLGFSF